MAAPSILPTDPVVGNITFEGIFRQAIVYHGRNGDTARHAMLDSNWPRAPEAFVRWLMPDHVDKRGMQRRSLAELRTG